MTDDLDIQFTGGFGRLIGMHYTEVGPDRVVISWDITPDLHQPYGIVHGGVYCSVVESAASIGAAMWWADRGTVVGVSNHTDFYKAISAGRLVATATPIHRGRSQQVWEVVIVNDAQSVVARGQVRLQNLDPR